MRNLCKFNNYLLIKIQFYSSIHQVRERAHRLNKLQSLTIDKLCQIYRQKFGKHSRNSVIQQFNEIVKGKCVENEDYLSSIQLIHEHLDKINIGFLRGDIHSTSIYKIQKFLNKKIDEQKLTELTKQDYKEILNQITNIKILRLPEKGIQERWLQSKKNLYNRQLLLEKVSADQAFDKFHSILDSLRKLEKVQLLQVVRRQIMQWFPPVCKAIKDQQLKCKMKDLTEDRKLFGEYFIKLNAQKVASLIISALMREILLGYFKVSGKIWEKSNSSLYPHIMVGIVMRNFIISIGEQINAQANYDREEKKFYQIQRQYDLVREQYNQKKERLKKKGKTKNEGGEAELVTEEPLDKRSIFQILAAMKLQYRYVGPEDRKSYLSDLAGKAMNHPNPAIPRDVQVKIGHVLVLIIKEIVKIKNKYDFRVPLLSVQHQINPRYKGKSLEKISPMSSKIVFKVNQYFLESIIPEIEKENDLCLHMDRSLPTIIEPLPWVDYEIGGYYLQSTIIMRFNHCSLQERAVRYADLGRVCSIMNYLGKIPWQINKKVLAVIEQLWEEGAGLGTIPRRYAELAISYKSQLKDEYRNHIAKQVHSKLQALRDQHSLRSSFIIKLNIARAYATLDRFYFPHNMDFRGRVYPVPPHLNHIGDDFSRGLLLFAEGKRIGKSGLKWLKIHCANLTGKDKSQIDQKVAYTEQNIEFFRAMARDPLKYRDWLAYEDCWQALSAITELNDALSLPNPEEYISHIHIHQDGSCNGLQHYAALGRDIQGAFQVNLGQAKEPGDVYTYVARMVLSMINADIADKNSPMRNLAIKLSNQIRRKTIKQTVMTSVYGVTFIGARQQIHRQLKIQNNNLGEQQLYDASVYIAKLTLQAIKNLFVGAHQIKRWLLDCAKLISNSNNAVSWITPLGLPVVQPYRTRYKTDVIKTIISSLTTPIESQNLPVNKSKQQSAFPPNFVHSLDSCHMMLTSERCKQTGICFAAVHDSYWTHAADVQIMNVLLRDQFVKLHSQPLLENLKNSFEIRYPNIVFPKIPERGKFDLQNVKKSIYFFS